MESYWHQCMFRDPRTVQDSPNIFVFCSEPPTVGLVPWIPLYSYHVISANLFWCCESFRRKSKNSPNWTLCPTTLSAAN